MTEKILAALFIFIKTLIAFSGYGGIVILMAIESACIPLPSELIMPFAGYLVFEGSMKLFWVATAGAIGRNVGSLIAYEVGYYGGRPLVERYGSWILLGTDELDWADRFFARWGYLAVFVAPPAAGRAHLYCSPCRNRPHALVALPRLHISRLLALVLRTRLDWHEARTELA